MTFSMVRPDAAKRLSEDFEKFFLSFIRARYQTSNELHEVMTYILEGTGKRVRPTLALLFAEGFGSSREKALPAAVALEMMHTYSLVHDDLPCMDNDSMRRGRPTAHVKFNEAMALLAGDALLTDVFSILADSQLSGLSHSQALAMIQELSASTGSLGMALGQALDLKWTGSGKAAPISDLDTLHLNKTGKLIGASCVLGAIAGSASPSQIALAKQFGERIGLAFQIIDDLVDGLENTGKTRGKDAQAGKLTYLTHMTRHEAASCARKVTDEAFAFLRQLDLRNHEIVAEYSEYLLERNN